MKKLICCLLVLLIIFSFAFGLGAWAEGPVHYDIESEQGTISFDIDEPLWSFVAREDIFEKLDPEKIDIQGQYEYMTENGIIADGTIFYENTDTVFKLFIYQFPLSPEEAVDFAKLSDAEFEELTELINEDMKTEGFEMLREPEVFSTDNQLIFVGYEYCLEDYYAADYATCLGDVLYQFRFECEEPFVVEEDEQVKKIVESISFTAPIGASTEAEAERSFQMPTALDVLISLVITIAVYSLPIIIYRYLVRKAPVEEQKAKKITIIYGIVGFVLMSAILIGLGANKLASSGVILWSYVNYRMLSN